MCTTRSSNWVACLLLLAAAGVSRLHTADATCSPKFGQCGGKLWNGPTCCEQGSKCEVQTNNGVINEYYSQCVPANTIEQGCASSGEQCGGEGWTGPTCCTPGNVCVTTGGDPTCVPDDQVPNASCAPKYGQCGGRLYRGPTCCEPGTTCQIQYNSDTPPEANEYYSQCLPTGASQPNRMPPTVTVYAPPTVTVHSPPTVDHPPPSMVTPPSLHHQPPSIVESPPDGTPVPELQAWAGDLANDVATSEVCASDFVSVLLAEPRLLTAGEYSQAFTGSMGNGAMATIDCGSLDADAAKYYGCFAAKAIFDAIGSAVSSCSSDNGRSTLEASPADKTSAAQPARQSQTRSLLTSFRQLLQSQTCIGVCPVCGQSSAWCNEERAMDVCAALGDFVRQIFSQGAWGDSITIGQQVIQGADLERIRQLAPKFVTDVCKAVFGDGCGASEQPCATCKGQNPSECGSFCCCASETGTKCPALGVCPNAGFAGSTCCCPLCEVPKGRNCECVKDTETTDPRC